jgi:hypothetical protein
MIALLRYTLVNQYIYASLMESLSKKDSNLEINVGHFRDFYCVSVKVETKVLT